MLRNRLFLLLLSVLLTSCTAIKDIPSERITKIEKTDFKKLNGKFSNYPSVSNGAMKSCVGLKFEPVSLWSQINGYRQFGTEDSIRLQYVTLDFVSKKKAIAKLWDNSELKTTKKIRGRIKQGYFYRRPYFVAVPLIPLLFGYNLRKYRIGISDDSIVVDYRWDYWFFAIASGNCEHGKSSSIYQRE